MIVNEKHANQISKGPENKNHFTSSLRASLTEDEFTKAISICRTAIILSRLRDHQILDVNEDGERMFGFSREEAVGRSVISLSQWASGEDRDRFMKELEQNGFVHYHEQTVLRKSGESLVVWGSAEIVTIDGEKLILSTWLDMTGIKRAEEELYRYQTELKTNLQAITKLQELSAAFFQAGAMDPVLLKMIETAIELSAADFGTIQIYDPDSSILKIVAHRGLPQKWLDFYRSVKEGEEVCGMAVGRRQRFLIEDIKASPLFVGKPGLAIQLEAGVRAMQATPLISRSGKPVGCFSTYYKNPYRPDGRVLQLLDVLARQAADMLERARTEQELHRANADLELRVRERTAELSQRAAHLRALVNELTISEQRERTRLAKILHDNLQQLLIAAKFQIRVLNNHVESFVKETAEEVGCLLDESIRETRSVTSELSPPVLHKGDLPAGLEWLARWMKDKHGLAVNLSVPKDAPPLDEAIKMLLFESARELLLNVVKHAHAESASVMLQRHGSERIQIIVSDNGSGFDTGRLKGAGENEEGFGLFSIRERIELIGGHMEVSSSPGFGSRFVLTVPVFEARDIEAVGPSTAVRQAIDRKAVHRTLMQRGEPIRVLLADDHKVLREGLARVLSQEPDIEILGEAADGEEAVEKATKLLPDVVLMDMSMPKIDGIEATRAIARKTPGIHVIGLSMFDDEERAQAMLEAGAVKYLTKSGASAELVNAIRDSIAH